MGKRQGQKALTLQMLAPRGESQGGERLSVTARGEVRYALKTPYRDGTTHVVFEPEDFLWRLAALVPSPRVNLTRFDGVFAPHHRPRTWITARRGDRAMSGTGRGSPRASAMGWAQRLKRAFSIDVESCDRCGGAARIIACIEDPDAIGKILRHLGLDGSSTGESTARAPQVSTSVNFDTEIAQRTENERASPSRDSRWPSEPRAARSPREFSVGPGGGVSERPTCGRPTLGASGAKWRV